jgi:hypothetical protein
MCESLASAICQSMPSTRICPTTMDRCGLLPPQDDTKEEDLQYTAYNETIHVISSTKFKVTMKK